MALPDTCPKCGEKATNDRGQCVFCGTQVITQTSTSSPGQQEKIMAKYRFASWSFVAVGIVYLLISIIGSIEYHKLLVGFMITGVIATLHGGLLVAKHEVVQSITKTFCIIRIALQLWVLLILLPLLIVLIVPGSVMLLVVGYDLVCLFIMYGTIDDVYFN